MNPKIKDNPDWTPFLEAVTVAEGKPALRKFMSSYPKRLRPVVALALSLAKWHLNKQPNRLKAAWDDYPCGCCALFYADYKGHKNYASGSMCGDCMLDGDVYCGSGPPEEVYARILRIYTEHFEKLPAQDKQRLAK